MGFFKHNMRRRGFLKFFIFAIIQNYLKPVFGFSATHMRRPRRIGGMMRTSQSLKLAATLTSTQSLRTSQITKAAIVLNNSQSLRTSQSVLVVAVPT